MFTDSRRRVSGINNGVLKDLNAGNDPLKILLCQALPPAAPVAPWGVAASLAALGAEALSEFTGPPVEVEASSELACRACGGINILLRCGWKTVNSEKRINEVKNTVLFTRK